VLPAGMDKEVARVDKEIARMDKEIARLSMDEHFWTPPRERLQRTALEVVSLHNLPKRAEARPRYSGSRRECHAFHPELSGSPSPPDNHGPSSPSIKLSLHSIGGFCGVSTVLPLPRTMQTQTTTRAVKANGMNAPIGTTVYCVAAEPHATFVRIAVSDGRRGEVAYETAVLGRLRSGYRVLQLRSLLGTRIECCFLFVNVSLVAEPNSWITPRHARMLITLKQDLERYSRESNEAKLATGSNGAPSPEISRV